MRGTRVTKAKERTVFRKSRVVHSVALLLRYLRSKRWKPCVSIIYHSHGRQVAIGFSWLLLLLDLVCDVATGNEVLSILLFSASEP